MIIIGWEFKNSNELIEFLRRTQLYEVKLENWKFKKIHYDLNPEIKVVDKKITIASNEIECLNIAEIWKFLNYYGYSMSNIELLDTNTSWSFLFWDILDSKSKRLEFAEGIHNDIIRLK